MTNQEMIKILRGSLDQKKALFDELLQKAVDGLIEENELPILETLKKELLVKKEVVQMSATLVGVGGVNN